MVLDVKRDDPRGPVLDVAEALFYARGVQAVGIDEIRDRAGISLKRLYRAFGSKQELLIAVLERRDLRWRARLTDHVERQRDPIARILAVFDWLELWFSEPDFRGCAWVNVYGELGAVSPSVADQARRHKRAFRTFVDGLSRAADLSPDAADALYLLAEGAIVTAGIFGTVAPAAQARAAARGLLAG